MKRCALYTRVSTDDQVNVRDGSLDTQMDQLERYVTLRTDTTEEPWCVAARYREEGRSGANLKRPQFQRLLADVQAGKTDIVLCTRIDRISRSVRDFHDFQAILKEAKIAFVSLGEQWDTSTPMGEFAQLISLGVAQLERRQISVRTSEKAQWRAEKGLKNGGQILGYDLNPDAPGIPLVNVQEAELVRLIYHTYLKASGLRSTAEIINRKGYRTKAYTSRTGNVHSGKEFTDSAILRLLTNAFFMGQIRHNDQLYAGQHKPIVPVDLFQRVQHTLDANRGKRGRPQQRHLFLLDGLVRCGQCGAFMTPTFSYNAQKKMYSYYACTSRNHKGRDACAMKSVPAEALEKVIADRLTQLSQQDRTVERLVKEAMADTDELLGNLRQRRTALAAQKIQVEDQIDALVESIAARRTQIRSVTRKILELEERKDQLDNELLDLDLEIEANKEKAVNAQSLTESLTTFSDLYREATPKERRELLRLRVNHLVWTPDEIRLAVLDQPLGPCPKFDESMCLVAAEGIEPPTRGL